MPVLQCFNEPCANVIERLANMAYSPAPAVEGATGKSGVVHTDAGIFVFTGN